jgi:hypothetical protein
MSWVWNDLRWIERELEHLRRRGRRSASVDAYVEMLETRAAELTAGEDAP